MTKPQDGSSGPMTPAERARQRSLLLKKAAQKDGSSLLQPASDRLNQYFLRRPSGITQLDIDCGGGLPAGALSCLSGPENAGKSTLMYLYCAMHQRIYGANSYIAIAHVEGAIDYDHMRKLGFVVRYPEELVNQRERDRIRRGLPKFSKEERAYFNEQVGEVDIISASTAEEVLETVLRVVESNLYGIVAVDSITALETEAQAEEEDLAKFGQQGSHASVVTKFTKKYLSLVADGKNKTTVIFTQQVRANRERANAQPHMQKYIPEFTITGAKSLLHTKSLDIMITKGEKEKDKEKDVVGRTIRYKTLKGKAGTHDEIAGEYTFTFEGGFDLFGTLYVEGLRLGVIEESKSKILVHKTGSDKPLAEFPSREVFAEAVFKNLKLELDIRREIMAVAKKDCTYVE